MEDKMFNDILDAIIDNATPDEIENIREKLNNHILNHMYDSDVLEELHSTYDSSSCPHCEGTYIIKYGKDSNGNQRFYCKHCTKSFSAITGTLFAYSKKEAYQWFLYMHSLFQGDTIVESANIVGICEHTSLVWRHKILSICATITDIEVPLQDIVYLDEKLVSVNHPGISTVEPSKQKRGISHQKRNIACAIDQHNNKIIQVSETGRIHSQELLDIYASKIPESCTVISDSLRSYHKLMKELKVTWIKIPSGKTEKDGYTLRKVNLLHSAIELFLHKYRGVSDKYLRNYIGLFKMKDRNKKMTDKHVFYSIYKQVMNSSCELRFEDFCTSFSYSLI